MINEDGLIMVNGNSYGSMRSLISTYQSIINISIHIKNGSIINVDNFNYGQFPMGLLRWQV